MKLRQVYQWMWFTTKTWSIMAIDSAKLGSFYSDRIDIKINKHSQKIWEAANKDWKVA